jgi:hypothetical protein
MATGTGKCWRDRQPLALAVRPSFAQYDFGAIKLNIGAPGFIYDDRTELRYGKCRAL